MGNRKKSYIVLILINISFLLSVGLGPLITIINNPNMELVGLVFLLASYFAWIVAGILSIITFLIICKVFNLLKPSKLHIVLITLLLNFPAVFSVTPGFVWYAHFRQYMATKDVNLETRILEEKIIPLSGYNPDSIKYAYKYKISVSNVSHKTLKDIPTKVSIGFYTSSGHPDYEMIIDPTLNKYTKHSYPTGVTILAGQLPFFSKNIFGESREEYPINVEIALDIPNSVDKLRYYMEANTETTSFIKKLWKLD